MISKPATRLLPGKFLTTSDPVLEQRVYYADKTRHWVVSATYLDAYGFSWPDDLVWVSAEEIRSFKTRGNLPRPWKQADMTNPPLLDPTSLRELAACTLRGRGVEFGAGTAPFCVPVRCEVEYADFMSEEEIRNSAYQAQLTTGNPFMDLTYVTGMEDMRGIPNGSLDFIVASHVIEHLRNPIRAFEQALRCLKMGGKLVLVVPEQTRTFDKMRKLTPLENIIEDYRAPSAERDKLHYYDYVGNVLNCPAEQLESSVCKAIESKMDLHFHTWTHATFLAMVNYIQDHLFKWSEVWSHSAGTGDGSIEFYFTLTK